jgi:two-component system repressor protein LuxO
MNRILNHEHPSFWLVPRESWTISNYLLRNPVNPFCNPFNLVQKLRNEALITSKTFKSNLTGFQNLSGLVSGIIEFPFLSEQKGLISQANGGVLFLDEIGELPLSMQSTLLHFVQNKTFSKVGSHKLEKVAVRLICATNRELLAEIKAGRFREDLYYRLNSVEIKLPALRERGEDILQLAKFFLLQFVNEEQKKFQGFSAEAEKKLLSCDWPGNVRQLQNAIHHVVVLNQGKVITAGMLAAKIDQNISDKNTPLPTESTQQIEPVENHSASVAIISGNTVRFYKDIEKEVILTALEFCGGNVEKTAKMLRVGPATIHRKKRQWKGDYKRSR